MESLASPEQNRFRLTTVESEAVVTEPLWSAERQDKNLVSSVAKCFNSLHYHGSYAVVS